MIAYFRKCYCINKCAFQHREGTVNLYRNGAFLYAYGLHPAIFSAYKSRGIIFMILDHIDEEDKNTVTICDGNKEIILLAKL